MREGTSQASEGAAVSTAEPLIFEQPLNERMRSYLRIDFLYTQALYHAQAHSQWSSRAAVTSLLDLLAIVTRADVRGDVLKELERQITLMTEFQRRPGVDVERLRTVIGNLSRLRNELMGAGSTYLQPLRDSAFLAAVRHRSSIPGGTCEFDLPDFYYWLSRPADAREEALTRWLAMLRPLCDAIGELLWLTRQGGKARREIATGGIFHITFDRDSPVQLLRVQVASDLGVYPEISGSHYRSSVRFVVWNGLMERPRQAEGDVPFEIICCS